MHKLSSVLVVSLFVLGFGAGCSKRVPKVLVPQTTEGLKCERECQLVFTTCQAGNGRNAKVCRQEAYNCRLTCPGATFEDGTPTIRTAPAANSQTPPPPPPAAP